MKNPNIFTKKLLLFLFVGINILFSASLSLAENSEFLVSMLYYDSRVGGGSMALNQSTPYIYESNTISGTIKLQANILGIDLSTSYEAGELEIYVYGLEKFGLQNVTVTANIFSYEHHVGTFNSSTRLIEDDYYIVRNKTRIEEGSSIDAMFQLLYRMSNSTSGSPFNNTSDTVYLIHNGAKSNEINFKFSIGKQDYYIGSYNSSSVNSYDGLGSDAYQYYWMNAGSVHMYKKSPSKSMYPSKGLNKFVITGLPSDCKAYWINSNNGQKLEFEWDQNQNAHILESIYQDDAFYLYIAAPKSNYNVNDSLNYNLSWYGNYFFKYYPENSSETNYVESSEKIAEYDFTTKIVDTIYPITGNIINYTIYLSPASSYTSSNLMSNVGTVNIGHIGGITTNTEYRAVIGLDGFYTVDAENTSRDIPKSGYYFSSIVIPMLRDNNSLIIDTSYDLYVLYENSSQYELYASNLKAVNGGLPSFQFPTSGRKVVGLYVITKPINSSISFSQSHIQAKVIFTEYPEGYETNGYLGSYGFVDMFSPDEDISIINMDINDYENFSATPDLVSMDIPQYDLSLYGHYLFRKVSKQPITADNFSGFVSLYDTLIEDNVGYSDYYITCKTGYYKDSSSPYLYGYNAYIILPFQIVLSADASSIKENILSDSFLEFIANDMSDSESLYNYPFLNSQFSNINDYILYLYNSITINVSRTYLNTIIHLSYSFDTPLEINKTISSRAFSEIRIPIRIFDDDILDYGNNIQISAYAQPFYTNGTEFKSLNFTVGEYSNNFDSIIISKESGNSVSGLTYQDVNDVDGDGDTTEFFNRFVSSITYSKALEAMQSITKLTSANNEQFTIYPKTVSASENYTYRIRATTASMGMTDLIIYDNLEVYSPENIEHWKGEFIGLDLSRAQTSGFVPTVYYSNLDNPGLIGEDISWNIYNGNISSEDVKSLAFDYGNQIIPSGTSISVDIIMRSPSEDTDLYAYNNCEAYWKRVDPLTNNIYQTEETLESNVTVISVEKQISDKKNLTIKKIWNVPDTITIPNSISVELYRDNDLIDEITVLASKSWEETILDLPMFSETGHEYNYSVVEIL